jgi:hypothetical protein
VSNRGTSPDSMSQVFPVTTPNRADITCMKNRHDAGQADNPQQGVLKVCAGLQVGSQLPGSM